MFRAPKPETIARNAARRQQERTAQRRNVQAQLRAKAQQENDPGGLWAEILADNIARNGDLS
jgi:hypothetical protein